MGGVWGVPGRVVSRAHADKARAACVASAPFARVICRITPGALLGPFLRVLCCWPHSSPPFLLPGFRLIGIPAASLACFNSAIR